MKNQNMNVIVELINRRLDSMENNNNERFSRIEAKQDLILESRNKFLGMKSVISVLLMAGFTIICKLVIP